MPVAERLRSLNGPEPHVDLDAAFAGVRRRAAGRRRRQIAAVAAAAAVMVAALVVGAGALVGDNQDAQVDTVDTPPGSLWLLPQPVPDGYRLSWVDLPPPSGDPSASGVPLWERDHDYAYGYVTVPGTTADAEGPPDASHELEVEVFLGGSLDDPQTVADRWGDDGAVATLDGRPVVRWTEGLYTSRLILEVDGGVVHVHVQSGSGVSFPDGRDTGMPEPELVDRFAASIVPVTVGEWNTELETSGADVASKFGPSEQRPVIEGDGWVLVHGYLRQPGGAGHQHLGIDFESPSDMVMSTVSLGDSEVEPLSTAFVEEAGGIRVVWGELPADATRTVITIGNNTFEADAVPVAGGTAFAVDVTSTTADDGTVRAVNAAGATLAELPIQPMLRPG